MPRLVTVSILLIVVGISAADEPTSKPWAYTRPQLQPIPNVSDSTWAAGPIDPFILAKLEANMMTPTEPVPRRHLLRRASFDLIGLPPTPEDVEAFVTDEAPAAYERRVDRLLASPHYGERWARLWLDVARYAEDQAHIVGNNQSLFYPNAYLYRDWVIDAFNADLSYDRFVRLQLAGDLIEPEQEEHRQALGFIGLGPKYYQRNSEAVMADEWEDRVDVVTRGLLGLTVACSRCHDHKYDPIPTEDYYALAGVFASTEMFNAPIEDDEEQEKDKNNAPKQAMHIIKEGKPTDLRVFIRGDVKNKGEVAPRRFLSVMRDVESESFKTGSGRRELAEAITRTENPLTARVFVNRIWGQLFGGYIVDSPSNFGSLGVPPTHPELLDDLSARFMADDWSMKNLTRELALSATYRQAATTVDGADPRDPANRLFGRMNRKRLGAEAYRDTVLNAAGRLEPIIGGPSLDPQDIKQRRRTVYSAVSRFQLDPMLAMFDFPDPNTHAERRVETTTPLQKLFVLNSPFMTGQADAVAKRLADDAISDDVRIQRAYQVLYGRTPTEEEVRLGLSFVGNGDDPHERWRRYTHVLLAANEMWFVD